MVFKGVGFSTDNLIGGFYGVGHTYLEMFYSMTKRLFYWFVELFDHKIVPNVPKPGNGGGYNPWRWYTKPMHNAPISERILDLASNKDLLINPFNVNIQTPTPWYKDTSTWLRIAGIGCTIGLVFISYKLLMDPSILNELINRQPGGDKGGAGGSGPVVNVDPGSPVKSYSEAVKGKAKDIGSSIVNIPRVIFNKLNPLNYIVASETVKAQYEVFLEQQNTPGYIDFRLYPFSSDNPYDSWFTKFKKQLFGETITQKLERAQDRMSYDRVYRTMTGASETVFSTASSVYNTHGANTPNVFGVG